MKKDVLNRYLETGKVEMPAETVAYDAMPVTEKQLESPMEKLLKTISATAMVAKDLHYKAHGKPFLANHELADMVAEIEKHKDTINEIYYMGELQSNPPLSMVICGGGVEIVRGLYGEGMAVEEDTLIGDLHSLCQQVADAVESVKDGTGIKSGTQAVLDEISKDAMQCAGFLKNVLNGMGTKTDAEAEAVTDGPEVEVKGVVVAQPEETPVTENSEGDDTEAIAAAEEDDEADKTPAERYMSIINK